MCKIFADDTSLSEVLDLDKSVTELSTSSLKISRKSRKLVSNNLRIPLVNLITILSNVLIKNNIRLRDSATSNMVLIDTIVNSFNGFQQSFLLLKNYIFDVGVGRDSGSSSKQQSCLKQIKYIKEIF